MNVVIKPKLLEGEVKIPPSKSLSHRAIIAASLAEGQSIVSNIIYSDDILATIDGMRALGATITCYKNYLIINGSSVKRTCNIINAKESGSTIRFLIPISLLNEEEITFVGENNLVNRPLGEYTKIFDKQKIFYEKGSFNLPLKIKGKLKPDIFTLNGNISSQFLTGLLFALPLLNGDSEIHIVNNLESRGYIDLTLDVLKSFGISIIVNDNYSKFIIKGNQKYLNTDYTVEGDYSQAAFFIVANVLGSKIKLLNLNENSKQPDRKILEDIRSFNSDYKFDNNVLTIKKTKPIGANIKLSNSPDLGPILSVLAAFSNGKSIFSEVERLKIKECDRVNDVLDELKKLGITCSEENNTMVIEGKDQIDGNVEIDSHNDHRLVMAFSILGTRTLKEIRIINASAVNKSFPNFFDVLKQLGGIVEYEK